MSFVLPRELVSFDPGHVTHFPPISFPEAAILLISDGDCDLWPGPTPEVQDSQTSCYSAHAQSQV